MSIGNTPEDEWETPVNCIRYFETRKEAEKFIKDKIKRGNIIEISDIQTIN